VRRAPDVATLNVVHFPLIDMDEIGLSEAAWAAFGQADGQLVQVGHAPAVESFSAVRGKIYGRPFGNEAITAIINDIAAGAYSDIELATLITACSGSRLDLAETAALTCHGPRRAAPAVGMPVVRTKALAVGAAWQSAPTSAGEPIDFTV